MLNPQSLSYNVNNCNKPIYKVLKLDGSRGLQPAFNCLDILYSPIKRITNLGDLKIPNDVAIEEAKHWLHQI